MRKRTENRYCRFGFLKTRFYARYVSRRPKRLQTDRVTNGGVTRNGLRRGLKQRERQSLKATPV